MRRTFGEAATAAARTLFFSCASVEEGNTVMDFGGGNSLTLTGFSDLALLTDLF